MKIIKLKPGQDPDGYIMKVVKSSANPNSVNNETQLTEFWIVTDFEQEWRMTSNEAAILHINHLFAKDYGASIVELQHFKKLDYVYEEANKRKVTCKELWLHDTEEFFKPVKRTNQIKKRTIE